MTELGQKLYKKAKTLIPGGTQLLSKRPEMFLPDLWPAYYTKALGAEVWDLDANRYVDMSYNGIGACVLGHADPDVNLAVKAAVDQGSMSTLNCFEEVELAELLTNVHPWADMTRFTRTGGEAMAVAVRIARAATGKDKVAFCGYHGWQDWYIAANLYKDDALGGHLLSGLQPNGVPTSLKDSSYPFHYNRLDELERIFDVHSGEIAAIVMEPMRSAEPESGFLEGVRRIADQNGAVLVFDEITIGFRMNAGGFHLLCPIVPDMAVFGKAIGNGFPMSAIIGTRPVMEAAQDSFISSTYWTERIGPVAALATINKFIKESVHNKLLETGEMVQSAWDLSAREAGLQISINGIPPLSHFQFEYENAQALKTLFTQLMLERGFLATNAFYVTYAHTGKQISDYGDKLMEVFDILSREIERGTVEDSLKGEVAHSGFARLA